MAIYKHTWHNQFLMRTPMAQQAIGLSTIYDLKAQKDELLNFSAVLKVAMKLQANIKTSDNRFYVKADWRRQFCWEGLK